MENIKCKSNTIAEGQQTAPKFHGGVLNELHIYHSSCGSHKAVKLM